MRTLIKNGHVIDPANNIDGSFDILINKGKIEDFNEVGVKALNSKTLVVNLENPAPYFLGLLGL